MQNNITKSSLPHGNTSPKGKTTIFENRLRKTQALEWKFLVGSFPYAKVFLRTFKLFLLKAFVIKTPDGPFSSCAFVREMKKLKSFAENLKVLTQNILCQNVLKKYSIFGRISNKVQPEHLWQNSGIILWLQHMFTTFWPILISFRFPGNFWTISHQKI